MLGADDVAVAAPRRTGARTRAGIPSDVLRALNEGREQTITLVEFLAVDQLELLQHVLADIGVRQQQAERILADAAPDPADGVIQRTSKIAGALHRNLPRTRRDSLLARLGGHRSDIAREWAALVIAADAHPSMEARLEALRPFACDEHMGVREIAWLAFRPALAQDLGRGIELLAGWATDEHPYVRRFASEGSRPRGVWTRHLTELKDNPERGLAILEPLRSDPSAYVRASVGNWLNDAAKSRPQWVSGVCDRWLRESPTAETRWIVRRAIRSI